MRSISTSGRTRATLLAAALLSLSTFGAAGAGRAHGKAKVIGVLNVNRASEAELRLLPGIGKGRAALIVERRGKQPFASLDELARMRGMRKLVQKLRAHLSVSGDSTLRPAPASGPAPSAHPAPGPP